MSRTLILIGVAWMLMILESDCGGGIAKTPPPVSKVSITTVGLVDGMVTFPYSQLMHAEGVVPLTWSVNSGSLPHNLNLDARSGTISGMPDTAQLATFTIQVQDATGQTARQSYTLNIKNAGLAQLQALSGQAPVGTIEIQGVSAGPFQPLSWQQNTLNWVPDVRTPMLSALPGAFQNIYSPWPLEQTNGWLVFYGGWDGTSTGNDRIYKVPTPDFLSFGSRTLVIDHGAFLHVNNENVVQLPDGSMHMICTTTVDQFTNDKPTYFSSPDGSIWNGTPEPYQAQLSDGVLIHDDPIYSATDYNGGNVLLWDNNAWTLYYSNGVFGGGSGSKVFRATSTSPPAFESAGSVLNTSHYANDVKKFQVGGKSWYLMLLYMERGAAPIPNPVFSYSLSTDGIAFGPESSLFGGVSAEDHFVTTPAFVTREGSILGVVYGADPVDLLNATNQIYARWLQKKVVITDSSGAQYTLQGGYGPDHQWLQAPMTGSLQGSASVYAEDGVTPLGAGPVNLSAGTVYKLVLQ